MLSSIPIRSLKRLATYLPLHRQATLAAKLLPRALWYRTALRVARAQGRLVARMGGNAPLTTALMLDHWLRELSFSGIYPIPYRSTGLEVCLTPGPKLFCWTHLPLTEVPMRVYFEGGGAPVAVVSDPGKIVGENEFQVFGWPQRMEALPADALLLSRVKATIRGGKSVVFLADPYLGGPMSDVPIRLAGKLRVPLIFQWASLRPDGVIEVTYREAPYPLSEDRGQVEVNLQFLREERDKMLKRLGWNQ